MDIELSRLLGNLLEKQEQLKKQVDDLELRLEKIDERLEKLTDITRVLFTERSRKRVKWTNNKQQ